jgi:hypothetical protein
MSQTLRRLTRGDDRSGSACRRRSRCSRAAVFASRRDEPSMQCCLLRSARLFRGRPIPLTAPLQVVPSDLDRAFDKNPITHTGERFTPASVPMSGFQPRRSHSLGLVAQTRRQTRALLRAQDAHTLTSILLFSRGLLHLNRFCQVTGRLC